MPPYEIPEAGGVEEKELIALRAEVTDLEKKLYRLREAASAVVLSCIQDSGQTVDSEAVHQLFKELMIQQGFEVS
jgi:hypothetical protein